MTSCAGGYFVLILTVVTWSLLLCVSGDHVEDDTTLSSCTNRTSGLFQCQMNGTDPRCDVKIKPSTSGLTWNYTIQASTETKTVSSLAIHPPEQYEGDVFSYFYVDTSADNISVGSTTRMAGQISHPEVGSVCITFWYATNRDGRGEAPTITVRNRKSIGNGNGKAETVKFIGSIKNNTGGEWSEASFKSCIWEGSEIIIEVEKTTDAPSVAAIGNIVLTHSTTGCHCSHKYNGMPACHFNKNWCGVYSNDTTDENLLWYRGESIHPETGHYGIKGDKPYRGNTGYFVYLDVGEKEAQIGSTSSLVAQLTTADASTDICVEFNYATTGLAPQTIHIYNKVQRNGNVSLIYLGELTDQTNGEWKVVTFIVKLNSKNHGTRYSAIAFEGKKVDNKSYIALDNMKVSRTHIPITTQTTTTLATTITTNSSSPTQQHSLTPTTGKPNTTVIALLLICPSGRSLLQPCLPNKPPICCVNFQPIATNTLDNINQQPHMTWTLRESDDDCTELYFGVYPSATKKNDLRVQPFIPLGNAVAHHPVVISFDYRHRRHVNISVVVHTDEGDKNFIIFDDEGKDIEEHDDDNVIKDGKTEWKRFELTVNVKNTLPRVEMKAILDLSEKNIPMCDDCIQIRNMTIGKLTSVTQQPPGILSIKEKRLEWVIFFIVSAIVAFGCLVAFIAIMVCRYGDRARKSKRAKMEVSKRAQGVYQEEMYFNILVKCDEMLKNRRKSSNGMLW